MFLLLSGNHVSVYKSRMYMGSQHFDARLQNLMLIHQKCHTCTYMEVAVVGAFPINK